MSEHCGCELGGDGSGVENVNCRYPAALDRIDEAEEELGVAWEHYKTLRDSHQKSLEAIRRLRDVLNGIIENDEHVKTCPCSTCKAFQEAEQWVK